MISGGGNEGLLIDLCAYRAAVGHKKDKPEKE